MRKPNADLIQKTKYYIDLTNRIIIKNYIGFHVRIKKHTKILAQLQLLFSLGGVSLRAQKLPKRSAVKVILTTRV